MKHVYIECQCSSVEHIVKVAIDEEEAEPYSKVWFEFLLNHWRPWYKRIWIGLKYMFKYQSKFGAFDTVCLEREQAERLIAILREAYPIKYDENICNK